MGRMSEMAAEKADEINALHWEYQEAFAALMEYQDKHPPAWRTVNAMAEIARLESVCAMARSRYERAEAKRYVV